MSKPVPLYVDGYVTPEREVTVIPEVAFPFENNSPPDLYPRILSRQYDVTPRYFTPKIGTRTSWTNYLLYAETFANAAWTKNNITNTDNALANPNDGSATMASGLETVTNAEHSYQQAYTFTAVQHTLSWIVQPIGRTWFRLKANDGTTNFMAFFNLSGGGYVGALANCTAAVVFLADGIFRVSITFTPAAAAGNVYLNYATNGSTVSYAGDVTKGAYVWGAQIVRASSAGPVIITTSTSRTVMAPNLDTSDPFAYMAYEDSPKNYNSAIAGIGRRFARIPATQYLFEGAQYLGIPAVDGTQGSFGQIQVNTPFTVLDIGLIGYAIPAQYAAYFSVNTGSSVVNGYLYGGSGFFKQVAVSAVTVGYATAGTFTITYKMSTTAPINYNETDANIAATVNALAAVVADGLTFTVTGGTSTPLTDTGGANMTFTRGSETAGVAPLSMNSSGLTVTTNNTNYHTVLDGFTDTFLLADQFTSTAHGLSDSNRLFYGNPDFLIYRVAAVGDWDVINANTISVPTSGQSLQYSWVGSNNSGYTGGTALIRTKTKRTFYLPGVTAGIATVSDIPVELGLQQNNMALINAVGAAAGYQTYQSNGPKPWPEAPQIYIVDALQIDADEFLGI